MNRLFAGLLLDDLLGLLFFGLKEGADPFEDIRAQDEGGGDDSLSACDIAITTALLVLLAIGIESPVLSAVGSVKGPVDVAQDCTLDVLCLGLDEGHLLIKFGEEVVAELIGFDDVGLCVGGRSLEVRQGWLDVFGVASVGQFN